MKYIIANWKMNFNLKDIRDWFNVFGTKDLGRFYDKTIMISPSHPYLQEIKDCCVGKHMRLCAQDVDRFEKGAYTGSTGVYQLKDFCHHVIVGHSERKESIDIVLEKRELCLKNGVTPIACFTKPEDAGKYYSEGTVLAWEDPSNISVNGKYRDKDPAEVAYGIAKIRKLIPAAAELIYGGSVNRTNMQYLTKIYGINGVLPGNASLDPDHFYDIILQA